MVKRLLLIPFTGLTTDLSHHVQPPSEAAASNKMAINTGRHRVRQFQDFFKFIIRPNYMNT